MGGVRDVRVNGDYLRNSQGGIMHCKEKEQVAYAIVEATAQTSRVTFHEASGTWQAEVKQQDLSGQTFWLTLAYEHVEAEAYWAIAYNYQKSSDVNQKRTDKMTKWETTRFWTTGNWPTEKEVVDSKIMTYRSHYFKTKMPPVTQSVSPYTWDEFGERTQPFDATLKARSEHRDPQQLDPATIEVTGDDFLGAGTYNRTARNEWVMEAQGRKFYIRYGVAHNNRKNFGTEGCRHCNIPASRSYGYRGWVISESNNNYYDGYKTLAYVRGRKHRGVTNSDDHNPFHNNVGHDYRRLPIRETTETQSMVVAGSKGKLSVTLHKVAQ